MAKKPSLKLVATAADPSAPPRNLGQHGSNLWRSILSEYEIDDAPGRELYCKLALQWIGPSSVQTRLPATV